MAFFNTVYNSSQKTPVIPTQNRIASLFLIFFMVIFTNNAYGMLAWHPLTKGLHYSHIPLPFGAKSQLHLLRVDPNYFTFEIAPAEPLKKNRAFVRELAERRAAFIGVNGGFFDTDNQPLGLRISHHEETHPIRRIPWWGIFTIENGRPAFIQNLSAAQKKKIDFAIQAGPRLIANGKMMNRLKGGFSERSGLCIDSVGRILIAVTEHAPITTNEFAHLLLKPTLAHGGPGCVEALNLDGGSSSQLYVNTKDLKLDVVAFNPVVDAILVLPKSRE